MAIAAKKLHALVKENKKAREAKHSSPPDEEEATLDDEDEDGDEASDEGEKKKADAPSGDDAAVEKAATRVESGNGDEDLLDLVAGYDPEEEGNPPEWVADEETWERAKAAVEKRWDEYDEPWAVVAHVYSSMGGKTR